jgi:hypothetical protein
MANVTPGLDVHEEPAAVRAVAGARPLGLPVVTLLDDLVVVARQVDVVHCKRERLTVQRQTDQPLAFGELVTRRILAEQETTPFDIMSPVQL